MQFSFILFFFCFTIKTISWKKKVKDPTSAFLRFIFFRCVFFFLYRGIFYDIPIANKVPIYASTHFNSQKENKTENGKEKRIKLICCGKFAHNKKKWLEYVSYGKWTIIKSSTSNRMKIINNICGNDKIEIEKSSFFLSSFYFDRLNREWGDNRNGNNHHMRHKHTHTHARTRSQYKYRYVVNDWNERHRG